MGEALVLRWYEGTLACTLIVDVEAELSSIGRRVHWRMVRMVLSITKDEGWSYSEATWQVQRGLGWRHGEDRSGRRCM